MTKFRVLDGGMGSELTRLGHLAFTDGDPLWSARLLADCPDAVKQVHYSFLECGSDIITTATYQASIQGFCDNLHINKEDAIKLMHTAVRIAKEACDEFWEKNCVEEEARGRSKPVVAGGLGPYGAHLHDMSEYHGNYVDSMTIEAIMACHRPQVKALVGAGLDLLAFETIPAQKEGEAIVQLLKEFPNTKAWLSFNCKDELHTSHGEIFSTAVMSSVANSPQIVAVGVNCCFPEHVKSLLSSLHGKTSLPLIAYPNEGGEGWRDSRWQDKGRVGPFVSFLDDWLSAGACWLGGCCKTSLSDLKAIREKMDAIRAGSI